MKLFDLINAVPKSEYAKVAAENAQLHKKVADLVNLCEVKDAFFKEAIADGLRHGSSLSAKHMADLNNYYNGR